MFYNMTVKQHSAYCLYLLFLSFCQTGLFVPSILSHQSRQTSRREWLHHRQLPNVFQVKPRM